jgi:hypothetical protein
MDNTIDSLDIHSGLKNTLMRAGIYTIKELTELSKEELLEGYGLGKWSVDEITKALTKEGLGLKGDRVLEAGTYTVNITRVSYSNMDIQIRVDQPISIEELKALGEGQAYNEVFSENSSEYEVEYIKDSTGEVVG